jgi:hypothetical protein
MLVCDPCWKRTLIPLRSAVLRARQAEAGGAAHVAACQAVLEYLKAAPLAG